MMLASVVKLMALFKRPDKWTKALAYAKSTDGDVHHINGHVVKLTNFIKGGIHKRRWSEWACWRCEETHSDKLAFEETDCHSCNCGFCPKEK